MIESDNGNSTQRGNYTGSKIAPKRKAQIVALLGAGETVMEIARRTGACRNVIMAIRNANYNEIQQRKELLATQAERNALLAGEQITEALHKGNIPPSALVPIYGVSIDKMLNLRGDVIGQLNVNHQHAHFHAHISDQSLPDIIASLRSEPKQQAHAREADQAGTAT